jgi:hypothetical protein
MALVQAMPVKAVARLVAEHDTRLWRVIHQVAQPDIAGAGQLAMRFLFGAADAIDGVVDAGSTAKSPMASSRASTALSKPPRPRPAATAPPETSRRSSTSSPENSASPFPLNVTHINQRGTKLFMLEC